MKKALILIDIQNDYFPGGNCELVGITESGLKSRDLLTYFRENRLPLFHIQHVEQDADAEFFVPNSPGVEIHEIVKPTPDETIIQKHTPNSFLHTTLEANLRNEEIDHIVITGHMSHMCVDSTARAALDHGYRCTIIEDSCATYDMDFKGSSIPAAHVHGAFMQALAEAGCEVVDLKSFLSHG